MFKPAYVLPMLCAMFSPGIVAAQEQPVVSQEFTGAGGTPVFWWTRRDAEYTLQFFTGAVVPQSNAKCEPGRASPPDGLDRGSFFIGNTIACLRGLDPTFGDRTLTLVDGRRAAGAARTPVSMEPPPAGAATVPVTPVPRAAALAAPPATPVQPPPEVQVWLLHRDGSIITPQRKSPVDPDHKYCGYGRCESGFVYGFDLAAGRNAVAVAYQMGNDYYIQKLQPFADDPE